jgi:hypothetical protein
MVGDKLMKPLLQSLTDEVSGLIQRNEDQFAAIVQADFNEALERSRNKIRTAHQWLKVYLIPNGEYDETEAKR